MRRFLGRNKTLIYEFEMEDNSSGGRSGSGSFSIQTALLYTTSSGERRLRVHNYIIPLSSDPSDVYKHVDSTALTALVTRSAIVSIYFQPIPAIRKQLLETTKQICLTGMSLNRVSEGKDNRVV